MIQIIYSAPCTYDPRHRGFAEAEIAYNGEHPVLAAEKYLRQISGARLYRVVKDGQIWLG